MRCDYKDRSNSKLFKLLRLYLVCVCVPTCVVVCVCVCVGLSPLVCKLTVDNRHCTSLRGILALFVALRTMIVSLAVLNALPCAAVLHIYLICGTDSIAGSQSMPSLWPRKKSRIPPAKRMERKQTTSV